MLQVERFRESELKTINLINILNAIGSVIWNNVTYIVRHENVALNSSYNRNQQKTTNVVVYVSLSSSVCSFALIYAVSYELISDQHNPLCDVRAVITC